MGCLRNFFCCGSTDVDLHRDRDAESQNLVNEYTPNHNFVDRFHRLSTALKWTIGTLGILLLVVLAFLFIWYFVPRTHASDDSRYSGQDLKFPKGTVTEASVDYGGAKPAAHYTLTLPSDFTGKIKTLVFADLLGGYVIGVADDLDAAANYMKKVVSGDDFLFSVIAGDIIHGDAFTGKEDYKNKFAREIMDRYSAGAMANLPILAVSGNTGNDGDNLVPMEKVYRGLVTSDMYALTISKTGGADMALWVFLSTEYMA
eukprot:776067_1